MSATKEKTAKLDLFNDSCVEAVEMKPMLIELIPEVINRKYGTRFNELPAYQAVRVKDAAYQGRLALAIATAMHRYSQEDYRLRYSMSELLGALLRGTLGLGEEDYLRLFKLYGLDFSLANPSLDLWYFPVGLTLAQVGRLAKKQGQLSPPMLDFLGQLLHYTNGRSGDAGKISLKVQEILNQVTGTEIIPTVLLADGDPFGQQLNQFVASLDPGASATGPWLRLLQLWQKANSAQPTAKLRKELTAAIAAVGADAVHQQSSMWLELLIKMPVEEKVNTVDYNNGHTYTYTSHTYLVEANAIVAKGLVWAAQPLADDTIRHLLASLAVKCYRKIPGKGPLAAGLGNACLLALAEGGLPGVAVLARVRPKIKQTNTQELIARHIEKASEELGVSPAEIEDMSVPDFDLKAGQVMMDFGTYTATLTLADGKADVRWEKDGKSLKSAPAALKATHADELKQLKNAQAQVQQTYTAQRDRLDRSFVEERSIPWPWFEQYYFNHGLLSGLVLPLIWRFHRPDGRTTDAMWCDGAWCNAYRQLVPAPDQATQLQLWHPVLAPAEEVLAWRELLEQRQLRQPLKQAFREVYLLTPPEERTATYSNRMAAHILKQHQFNSLAKLRGWRYSLLGAYDKGYDSETATLYLPAHDLQAEFWVSEVHADDAWNDTGIYLYVSTDQVRFCRLNGSDPLSLTGIAPLVFSEVMRDVDLFVGVASVGNDPLWRDNGGLPAYRTYWEQYSFGELGEVAKNRKAALERLVPRLKIGKVSEIKDKFLVVQGKLRTYKIHLGSGNILMEPNDQYLCIVPDRSAKTVTTDVFLPFEGDAVLSIILSKALLLMDDDKITDETINRQIKMKK